MTRRSRVRANPGELKVAWGYDDDFQGPTLVYAACGLVMLSLGRITEGLEKKVLHAS